MKDKPIDEKQQLLDNLVSFGLGDMIEEWAEAQKKVLAGVRETAKQGTLTINLKFKRNGKFGTDVDYEIKKKVPKPANKTSPMFQDEDNFLHEQDPNNKQVDMEDVIDMQERKEKAVNEV